METTTTTLRGLRDGAPLVENGAGAEPLPRLTSLEEFDREERQLHDASHWARRVSNKITLWFHFYPKEL